MKTLIITLTAVCAGGRILLRHSLLHGQDLGLPRQEVRQELAKNLLPPKSLPPRAGATPRQQRTSGLADHPADAARRNTTDVKERLHVTRNPLPALLGCLVAALLGLAFWKNSQSYPGKSWLLGSVRPSIDTGWWFSWHLRTTCCLCIGDWLTSPFRNKVCKSPRASAPHCRHPRSRIAVRAIAIAGISPSTW